MFELRWFEGRLQFRQWKVRIDATGAITPTPLPIEWTEWTDIPEITNG